ncbi:uncharacterized protein LOC143232853 [Tachypleus tridentatus]|uniref:uncharacterized protein LOC143232853 n=1 Tax=Tachypleus tridentatus TaxID=6853 RepID=UPI003FD68ADB
MYLKLKENICEQMRPRKWKLVLVSNSIRPLCSYARDPITKQFHCTEDNTRLKVYPDVTLSTTRANGEKSGELERTKKRHQKNFSWPGVEAVLERYEHHLAEQRSEKEFLSERCQELNLRNKQFNCQMKRMRQHLKKLLTLKHHLEEDRHHYQKP